MVDTGRIFMLGLCSAVLLLLRSSGAQESSESAVQGNGGSDGQPAFRLFELACTHAIRSFEDLFVIKNMEGVYREFRMAYESSDRTEFLHTKADTSKNK